MEQVTIPSQYSAPYLLKPSASSVYARAEVQYSGVAFLPVNALSHVIRILRNVSSADAADAATLHARISAAKMPGTCAQTVPWALEPKR